MRITFLAMLSFLSYAIALDSSISEPSTSTQPAAQTRSESSTSEATPTKSAESTNNNWWQPIPEPLQNFIAQFNSPHPEADSPDLRKRQKGVGGAAEPEATTTIATQMSPVTTYMVNGKPVVFTQTFAPTPDPWSGPVNGQIGLGTIQGSVGVVRSDS